jgi:indole-3-glycerol phosphate synthase/phosphoribosylanthranilate isomerase
VTIAETPDLDRLPPPGDDGVGHAAARRRRNIVAEIAERRRADVREEMAALSLDDHLAAAEATPAPRDLVGRLAAPGLHLIAEIKRSSPSAGAIAAPDDDIVARARAYEAGGATAISVLCEPHWFGGSVADLRVIRANVSVPVLAKEFVVEEIQLPHLRAAGADAVLLLAILHPAKRLGRLVDRALEIGLEPLVEVHEQRELERALATNARIIGINNRDLRTLAVETDRAVRLRDLVPEDRLVVAESGVRDTATVAAWRAVGFDAALVGEALVRAADPKAAVRAYVGAGQVPTDPANLAAMPIVKICGITDAEGILAAVRSGAEAIGLNLVPGTPRALELAEAVALARVARSLNATPPRIVAITADAGRLRLAEIVAAVDPDAIQLSGDETVEDVRMAGRPVWKAVRVAADGDTAAAAVDRAQAFLDGGAQRILLDAAGGPHPGGTGIRIPSELAAAVAREVPVVLAGGLAPENVGPALRSIAAIGVDSASGTERSRQPGERPTKDPLRVALFVKRAKAARLDRPNRPARPTPAHAGLLAADDRGRWGVDREFGGRYVPESATTRSSGRSCASSSSATPAGRRRCTERIGLPTSRSSGPSRSMPPHDCPGACAST